MRVVDTSAWIEWLAGSATGNQVVRHFPKRSEWIVPTIVQLELVKWTARVLGKTRSAEILALSTRMNVVVLNTFLAERAAGLATFRKLALADSIIYATALETGADLLTCDAHFKGLPGVVYIPKTPQ